MGLKGFSGGGPCVLAFFISESVVGCGFMLPY